MPITDSKRGLLLLTLFVLIGALLIGKQILHGGAPHWMPDSYTYTRDFDARSLDTALSSHRTILYPVFAKLVQSVSPDLSLIVVVQFFLMVSASVYFFYTLLLLGFSGWISGTAAGALLLNRLTLEYSTVILPELLAASAAIFAVCGVLRYVVGHQRHAYWIMVAGLLCAYQAKPFYLYLIIALPLIGTVTRALTFGRAGIFRDAGLLLCGSLVPFLLFCAFRYAIVGHFGLVSFGGTNLAGITAQMLDRESLAEISDEWRPAATEILRRYEMETHPDWVPSFCFRPFWDRKHVDRMLDNDCYNYLSKALVIPYLTANAGSQVEANRISSQFSWEILRTRPEKYVGWLMRAFLYGVSSLLRVDSLVIVLFAGMLVGAIFQIVRVALGRQERMLVTTSRSTAKRLLVFIATTFIFFFGGLCLAMSVEPPIARYVLSAALFIPPMLVILNGVIWWLPLKRNEVTA
jgi:hypothetical protein